MVTMNKSLSLTEKSFQHVALIDVILFQHRLVIPLELEENN
jgi:hypothetical protein